MDEAFALNPSHQMPYEFRVSSGKKISIRNRDAFTVTDVNNTEKYVAISFCKNNYEEIIKREKRYLKVLRNCPFITTLRCIIDHHFVSFSCLSINKTIITIINFSFVKDGWFLITSFHKNGKELLMI